MLFLFLCLNFSNKSKIKCETNAAAISGGMSHTMFPAIFVSILLYNLQKMFFSTFQQISMSNSHRTSCEFLKDIFGRISGADSGARWSPSRIPARARPLPLILPRPRPLVLLLAKLLILGPRDPGPPGHPGI